jgi:DNA replication and repair protein RecF
MKLEQISLLQFRNYSNRTFEFPERITGICGPNGSGKTNLLDAIYYLCVTKSYFAGSDAALVQKGMQGFRVEGRFSQPDGKVDQALAILRETGKKEFSFGNETYQRLSAHIGKLPAVFIAPDDITIITGGSEERRKLADALLCQLFPAYLQQLMEYNKLLQQRNSLLKQMGESGKMSDPVLDVLDEQLAQRGIGIYLKRRERLLPFLEQSAKHYYRIAPNDLQLSLRYDSQLNAGIEEHGDVNLSYREILAKSRGRDLALMRTTAGIHRDDLTFLLNGQPFRQMASQGQRKSLLFALKLTEYEVLEAHKGFAPLLLLDDVFEKLDAGRMHNLLFEVCIEKQGQVIITDTHCHRLQDHLQKLECLFEVLVIA